MTRPTIPAPKMTIFFIYAPILVCDIRTSFINQDGPGFNSINARLLDDLGQDADIRGQPKDRQVVERKEGLSAELPTDALPVRPAAAVKRGGFTGGVPESYDISNEIEDMTTRLRVNAIALLALATALVLPRPAAAAEEPSKEKNPYKARLIGVPFVYYSPETKLAFGGGGVVNFRAGRHKAETRTSSVWAYASYNMAKQFGVMVKPEITLDRNNLYIGGLLRWERSPQKFFGVGDDMPAASEETFTPRRLVIELGVKRRLLGPLFAGLRFDLEQTTMEKVEAGGLLDAGGVSGSRGGTLSGFGLSLDWDTRDAVLFPRRGSFVQFTADAYGAMAGSDFPFNRLVLDLRRYFSLGADRVLAVQAYVYSSGGDVPFQRLAQIGGESLLRGYYKGRFRDKGLVAVQAEYRALVTKRIGVAGFAGLGDLFPGWSGFRADNLKYSVGTGLRYVVNKRDGTTLRLDLAWGRASFGLYVTAKEAF